METTQRIIIPLSKTKVSLLLLGSLAFVASGFWFVTNPPPTFLPPMALKLVGVLTVLFFSLTGVVAIRKMLDTEPGIVIDEEGIKDNSSGLAAGLIPWRDIKDLSVLEIGRQKMIMIHVTSPQKYIDRQPSFIQKKVAQLNLNNYGSPISLSANTLKCSFDELFNILKTNMEKHV
jgi:hypothetical protein